MKIIILTIGLLGLSSFTSFDDERDCVEEANRVYDLALHLTGNPDYADSQSTDWLTGCIISEIDANEAQLELN